MDKLNVFVGEHLAGMLIREKAGYCFEYLETYTGSPVFLGWGLTPKRRKWEIFPPAFDNLLPEGVLLEQLLIKHKLDRGDKWGQLQAVGLDLTGFLSVLPPDSEERPIGKVTPGKKRQKRARIYPKDQAVPYSISDLVSYHSKHKLRMSLSGVQPKVSAVFSRKGQCFTIVETNGTYILKPAPQAFPGAVENEALTMNLARHAGIEVPHCGWTQTQDRVGVFWIERFDRWGRGNRLRCEDACQILEVPASWKYLGNLETLARMIREHCSNPRLQLARFFQRVLFCWVTGNGDMHLKNWSLIENGPLIELAPAYDLLSTRILIDDDEDSGLDLGDKKTGLTRETLIDYLGHKICSLNERIINNVLQQLKQVDWETHILASHLPTEDKHKYWELVQERLGVITG